jgi:hypothetical protein
MTPTFTKAIGVMNHRTALKIPFCVLRCIRVRDD